MSHSLLSITPPLPPSPTEAGQDTALALTEEKMTRQRSKYQGPFPSFLLLRSRWVGSTRGRGNYFHCPPLALLASLSLSLSISRLLRRGDRLMTSEGRGRGGGILSSVARRGREGGNRATLVSSPLSTSKRQGRTKCVHAF